MSDDLITGGGAVGVAWVMRELLAFFLKLRKQDKDEKELTYQPNEQWRQYCTSRLEDLTNKMNQLFNSIDNIKNQVLQLQIDAAHRRDP